MSRLVTNGFEMQTVKDVADVSEGQLFQTFGSPVFDTSTVRSGSASLKCVSGSINTALWNLTGALDRSYWLRFYFRFASNPSAITNFIRFRTAGAANVCFLKMLTTGVLRPTNQASVNIGTASSALTTGTWHKIDMLVKHHASPASNNGTLAYWIDDVQIGSTVTNIDLGTTAIGIVTLGNVDGVSNGIDLFFDDVALNDDQGANENTRSTGGKIILAKPTSDVSRASWVQGDGSGTTNLYQAVDNTPPTGKALATPPAATDQIRNAATGTMTNERYVGNLPTRLGLGTDDIPKIVQAIATVSNSAANARSVGVQCYTNPTDTEQTSPTPIGPTDAYPSAKWTTIRGQVNYDPTVANSASQVAVRKTDNTPAEEISCAFLGVYVEYTPVLGLTDSVTASESLSDEPGPVKTETVTTSDTEVASVGQAQADTVTASDTERADVTTTQADSATLSDSVSKEPGPVVADSVTASDTITGKDVTVGRTEALTLTDALAVEDAVVIGDSVTTSDARVSDVTTTKADAVTLSDAVSSAPGLAQADSVTLSDSQAKDVAQALTDSVTVADGLTTDFSGAATLDLSDDVTLSDALTTEDSVVLGDAVTLSDQCDPALIQDFTQAENDSVALSDFLSTHLETEGSGTTPQPPAGGGFAVRVPVIKPAQHTVGLADVLILSDALRRQSHLDPDLQREEEELLALV